ncbi:MAG: hypothetical protein RI932_985, partial [Pseudomonadota bacterium]
MSGGMRGVEMNLKALAWQVSQF